MPCAVPSRSRLSASRLAYSANRSTAEIAEQRDRRKRPSVSPEAAHPTHGARAAQRGWQAGPGPGGPLRRAPGSRSVGTDGCLCWSAVTNIQL